MKLVAQFLYISQTEKIAWYSRKLARDMLHACVKQVTLATMISFRRVCRCRNVYRRYTYIEDSHATL